MKRSVTKDRLSQISTAWTLLYQAHEGATAEARAARRQLLQDYGAPVYRYLRAAVCDPETTDEIYQDFALRFVQGSFKNADPQRGRFRDFLKTALFNLVVDHRRRQGRQARPLPDSLDVIAPEEAGDSDSDQLFLTEWREELLTRAWRALQEHQLETGQPLYAVLRLRADQPELSSAELAERLGSEWSLGNVRKRLHQARGLFTDHLVRVVAMTLESPDVDRLSEELQNLGLLDNCRQALRRYAEIMR